MIRLVLMSLLASLNLTQLTKQPDLVGLATWYDPCSYHINPGDKERCAANVHRMANGEPYIADALTVAVDKSHQDEWLNREAIVLTECGKLLKVKITDTGMLYAADRFRRGFKKVCGLDECTDVLRYWPTTTNDILWSSDLSYQVIADFPKQTFRRISCKPDAPGGMGTTVVAVWVPR